MIQEINNKLIVGNSIIDEAFDVKNTSTYSLIIQVGITGVLVTVYDKAKNKLIALEIFSFQNAYNFDVVVELFDLLAKESKLIGNKYKSVVCSVVNDLSTLVPAPLFDESNKKAYLELNVGLEDVEFIEIDKIKSIDAQNVFAVPSSLKTKLNKVFGNVIFKHFSSGLLESLLVQNKNQTGKKLYAHVQSSRFEVILIEGKNLLFYNTFNYQAAEDFIYYLLFVCEQMQLNPENIEVVLLGEIERNSTIFSLCQKYIRNLKFGERAANVDYCYQLQSLSKHYYFSLFNNYLL